MHAKLRTKAQFYFKNKALGIIFYYNNLIVTVKDEKLETLSYWYLEPKTLNMFHAKFCTFLIEFKTLNSIPISIKTYIFILSIKMLSYLI